MNLQEVLDKFFKTYKKKIKVAELIKILKIDFNYTDEIQKSLYELEKTGKIYKDEFDFYIHVPKDFYLKHGSIKKSNRGNYYIESNHNKILISKDNLNGAKEDDIVFVEIETIDKKFKKYYGKVKRIVSKQEDDINIDFICKGILQKDYKNEMYYVLYNNNRIVIPFNKLNSSYPNDIVSVQVKKEKNILKGNIIGVIQRSNSNHVFEYHDRWIPIGTYPFETKLLSNKKFNNNDRILATINENNQLVLVKRLDNEDSLMNKIKSIIYDNGLDIEFSDCVKKEVNSLNCLVNQELSKRKDLRHLTTITIDPVSAKDLDDAISLEETQFGYRLYVHIADVSHYVKLDTHLYNEARNRALSGYFSDVVVPMLPDKLCNDLCSLKANEDKLAKTAIIDIDFKGNVTNYEVFKSVIRSNAKLNYDDVNKFLNGDIIESCMPYSKLLLNCLDLSKILQRKRIERGFIEFKIEESQFEINDNKINIKTHLNDQAQLIIENFMLINNECCTSYLHWLNLPIIYRNHKIPDYTKVINLNTHLKEYNYYVRPLKNVDSPKVLQRILITLSKGKSTEEREFLSKLLLKYMSRATYNKENYGHYGLALDYYATFTSPIRKFSDLINHMVLDNLLNANDYDLEYIEKELESICYNINEQSLKIEQVNQAVNNSLLNSLIEENDVYEGVITLINQDGIYLRCENNLKGLIPVSNFMSFHQYGVNIKNELYQIGDKINVKVLSSKGKDCEVTFELEDKIKVKKLERR